MDFNQNYDEKIDIIYSHWPKVSQAILKEAEQRHTKIFAECKEGTMAFFMTFILNFSQMFLVYFIINTPVLLKVSHFFYPISGTNILDFDIPILITMKSI